MKKIDAEMLLNKLLDCEKRHRNLADTGDEKYETAFADGLQQSMNIVTEILDEIRLSTTKED